jgi:hypothetical protein
MRSEQGRGRLRVEHWVACQALDLLCTVTVDAVGTRNHKVAKGQLLPRQSIARQDKTAAGHGAAQSPVPVMTDT